MPNGHSQFGADNFALLSALVVHMIGGGDCKTLLASGVYPDLVKRVFRKSESVMKLRFNGQGMAFYTIMLIRVYVAIEEKDHDMIAIEYWLDAELREAGIDPRSLH